MQYSETHSLRKDAKFILTSAEVSSRLKHGSLSNHSHLLAIFFFFLKASFFFPFKGKGVVSSMSSTAVDKTASLSNIHFISFVQYEQVQQKCKYEVFLDIFYQSVDTKPAQDEFRKYYQELTTFYVFLQVTGDNINLMI